MKEKTAAKEEIILSKVSARWKEKRNRFKWELRLVAREAWSAEPIDKWQQMSNFLEIVSIIHTQTTTKQTGHTAHYIRPKLGGNFMVRGYYDRCRYFNWNWRRTQFWLTRDWMINVWLIKNPNLFNDFICQKIRALVHNRCFAPFVTCAIFC